MNFNQDEAMPSQNSDPLKLVDQFIYLGSNISSTEINVLVKHGNLLIG